MTPLHWAIQSGFSFIVAELFNNKKDVLNLDAVDEFDDSIRDYVRNSRNDEMIDTFCKFTGENKDDYANNQNKRYGMDFQQNNNDKVDDDDDDDDDIDSDDTDSDTESDDSDSDSDED